MVQTARRQASPPDGRSAGRTFPPPLMGRDRMRRNCPEREEGWRCYLEQSARQAPPALRSGGRSADRIFPPRLVESRRIHKNGSALGEKLRHRRPGRLAGQALPPAFPHLNQLPKQAPLFRSRQASVGWNSLGSYSRRFFPAGLMIAGAAVRANMCSVCDQQLLIAVLTFFFEKIFHYSHLTN